MVRVLVHLVWKGTNSYHRLYSFLLNWFNKSREWRRFSIRINVLWEYSGRGLAVTPDLDPISYSPRDHLLPDSDPHRSVLVSHPDPFSFAILITTSSHYQSRSHLCRLTSCSRPDRASFSILIPFRHRSVSTLFPIKIPSRSLRFCSRSRCQPIPDLRNLKTGYKRVADSSPRRPRRSYRLSRYIQVSPFVSGFCET